MLHAGLDLSRRRLDVCLLGGRGEVVAETAVPADADGLRGLAGRLAGRRVRAVIESMNGARFVHDTLEEHGWEVLIADATQGQGGWRRWRARPTGWHGPRPTPER
jgi:transposase